MNKQLNSLFQLTAVASLFMNLAGDSRADETIRYFGGPAVSVSVFSTRLNLDLNFDGQSDWAFEGSGPVCTAGIPGSCVYSVVTVATNGTAVLTTNNSVSSIPLGALVGPQPPTGAVWSTNTVTIATQKDPTTIIVLLSTLQDQADGFLGFQFDAADGTHFGWMHVRISTSYLFPITYIDFDPIATIREDNQVPNPNTQPATATASLVPNEPFQVISLVGPIVTITEWAYETRPNTPIAVGAIPAPSPIAAGIGSRAGNLRLAWQSEPGAAYCVQFKDSLTGSNWEVVNMRIVATSATAAAENPTPGTTRFFRIIRAD